jgi:tRNA uridine 5-carboxymethylaminomethyl modification enzyme
VFAYRKYEAYIVRQRGDNKRQGDLEHRRIPGGVRYEGMAALRTEARAALVKFRPATFGQAGRLEGVTPADLTLLSVLVRTHERGDPGQATVPAGTEPTPMLPPA